MEAGGTRFAAASGTGQALEALPKQRTNTNFDAALRHCAGTGEAPRRTVSLARAWTRNRRAEELAACGLPAPWAVRAQAAEVGLERLRGDLADGWHPWELLRVADVGADEGEPFGGFWISRDCVGPCRASRASQ